MYRKLIAAAALALAIASPGPASAQWIKAGVLGCDVSGGWGWIIGSAKSVSCTFTPDVPGPPEYYVGVIRKFGLDIGATGPQAMVWGVFASTWGGRGALAGDYAGATGQATVALGLGANVLVGGSNRTVALQPVSLTGQTGLNLAVGVADLQIRLAR
jgi:Protein of unknown function (DUF992)